LKTKILLVSGNNPVGAFAAAPRRLRGGFAAASRRLRGGFAAASRRLRGGFAAAFAAASRRLRGGFAAASRRSFRPALTTYREPFFANFAL